MTANDEPEFARILLGLSAIKPGKDLTAAGIAIYWQAMQDWSIDEFRTAAAHLARTVEFMPNPYHFEQLRKAGGETAGEAWTRVRALLRDINWHQRVSISPRIDRVVAAMGGYQSLAMTNSDAMQFREKRFAELWDELGEADEARIALPSAAGRRLAGPALVGGLLEARKRNA